MKNSEFFFSQRLEADGKFYEISFGCGVAEGVALEVAFVSLLYCQFHLYLFIFLYKHSSPFNLCVHNSGAARNETKRNEKNEKWIEKNLLSAKRPFLLIPKASALCARANVGSGGVWVIDGMDIWNNDNNNNNTFFWQFESRWENPKWGKNYCRKKAKYESCTWLLDWDLWIRNLHLNFFIYISIRRFLHLTCFMINFLLLPHPQLCKSAPNLIIFHSLFMSQSPTSWNHRPHSFIHPPNCSLLVSSQPST